MAAINQSIVNLGQLNIEEMVREIEEEEVIRMLKIIIEDNTKILELQSMLALLLKNEKSKMKKDEER